MIATLFLGDGSFILFNLLALIAILLFAMFAFFKGKKMKYAAVMLASLTIMMYVLTFSYGTVHIFDRMSIVYGLILLCNVLFATMKRIEF